MNDDADKDVCSSCRQRNDVVFLKIRLTSISMIMACPNCAMATADEKKLMARNLTKPEQHGRSRGRAFGSLRAE
jgi:hypothetical protein